ncbi:hypothetical protein DSO57_1026003 [Entomophthora muscae]|uniref:Uncharacterized protein n=1 Tax=Entomophthora muscae TaxID=34485 RepID=A0ACC2RTD7_9FUNG|nr:hypothetical protein DSO57_1026003 [Entomophthora muscae]
MEAKQLLCHRGSTMGIHSSTDHSGLITLQYEDPPSKDESVDMIVKKIPLAKAPPPLKKATNKEKI